MAFFNKISVEIPLFFCFVSFLLTSSVLTNLIVYRTCYIILDLNKTQCAELGNESNNDTQRLETIVEPKADIIIMTITMISSLFPIFICMMAASWSDKHGRKPVMLMCLIGMTIGSCLEVVFSFFEDLSPWYILISILPAALTGSSTTYFTITLTYLSDISTPENRATRMLFYEVALATGVIVGSLPSSYIFYATNYQTVFGIGACCMLISTLYVFFFIPESLKIEESNLDTSKSELVSEAEQGKRLLSLEYLTDIFHTAFKKRENYTRALILLTMASIIITTFAGGGDYSIQFLFLRQKLNWTLTKYTLYVSGYHALLTIVTMSGSLLLNKFKIRESVLVLIGLSSLLSCAVLQLLATADAFIYIAGTVKCLGGLVTPLLRSQVSRLVPANEAGKLFSIIVGGGALITVGASPLYTTIYNATIDIDAALFNILTITLFGVTVVLILIGIILENKSGSIQQSEINKLDEHVKI